MQSNTTAYGINPQSSLMFPCSEEVSQVLTVCHGAAVVVMDNKLRDYCYGIKYKAGVKSQKPFSEDIAQCLSSECHDAAVVLVKRRA